jgi:hypothetical protein
MVLDTKAYWLTDRQSQYVFDFDLTWIQGNRGLLCSAKKKKKRIFNNMLYVWNVNLTKGQA